MHSALQSVLAAPQQNSIAITCHSQKMIKSSMWHLPLRRFFSSIRQQKRAIYVVTCQQRKFLSCRRDSSKISCSRTQLSISNLAQKAGSSSSSALSILDVCCLRGWIFTPRRKQSRHIRRCWRPEKLGESIFSGTSEKDCISWIKPGVLPPPTRTRTRPRARLFDQWFFEYHLFD